LARVGATFTSTFTAPDVGWTFPVSPEGAAETEAPEGDGAVTDAPAFEGAGAVTDAPGLGDAGDGVIEDGVVGAALVLSVAFAGSAIAPGDVVVVVPLTPAFFDVSGCGALTPAFFEVSGCVVCCAAAGIDIAASIKAASVYRCVMVRLSCIMMLWVFRPPFDGQHSQHRTYHATAPQNRDICERKSRTVTECTTRVCDVSRVP